MPQFHIFVSFFTSYLYTELGMVSHHELSRRAARALQRRGEVLITPAMASGLTDHIWSVRELLTFRISPPLWVAPKRRGRPRTIASGSKKPVLAQPRPLLRLRKGPYVRPPDKGVPPSVSGRNVMMERLRKSYKSAAMNEFIF